MRLGRTLSRRVVVFLLDQVPSASEPPAYMSTSTSRPLKSMAYIVNELSG